MSGRSLDDFVHERGVLDAAHAQNEAGRDAFIALAHTALFAASVSFVGDVAPITKAIWRPALIACWLADVIGLLALTFSFSAARRAIDARRAALNEENPPEDRLCEQLNAISLWSFPVALLCLFSFVTANLVNADGQQINPSTSASGELSGERDHSSTASANSGRHCVPGRRSNARAASACGTSTPTSATKEVKAKAPESLSRARQ